MTLCHGGRPFLSALLASDPYVAQTIGIEAWNDRQPVDVDTDNTAIVSGATQLVPDASDNDNVASARPRMRAGVESDTLRITFIPAASTADNTASATTSAPTIVDDPTDNTASAASGSAATIVDDPTDNTASAASTATVVVDDPTDNTAAAATTTAEDATATAFVSLPGSDNVIAAFGVPRRKGSMVAVIDDPTDNTASAASSSIVVDDPTDNTASAATIVVDDPTDNTVSAATSADTIVDDPSENTASAVTSEEATTTAFVSLPGSDNLIAAYGVPGRVEGMLVVADSAQTI
ncbi:hypothetical protein CLOM_g19362 [Closterium sp. NIES-68]|nr:hypothetical protein CLOM_g19362 [Closterium sp. NIES-68]GJP76860.1 hypothetical protein CLOP_g7310 [Closterium sp. NIES-67]